MVRTFAHQNFCSSNVECACAASWHIEYKVHSLEKTSHRYTRVGETGCLSQLLGNATVLLDC